MKRGDSYLTDYKDLVNSDFSEKADNYIDIYPTTRGDNSRFTMAGLPEIVKLPSLIPNINTWLEVIPTTDTLTISSPQASMAPTFVPQPTTDTHERHMRLLASLEDNASIAKHDDSNEVLVNVATSSSSSSSGDEPAVKKAKTDAWRALTNEGENACLTGQHEIKPNICRTLYVYLETFIKDSVNNERVINDFKRFEMVLLSNY